MGTTLTIVPCRCRPVALGLSEPVCVHVARCLGCSRAACLTEGRSWAVCPASPAALAVCPRPGRAGGRGGWSPAADRPCPGRCGRGAALLSRTAAITARGVRAHAAETDTQGAATAGRAVHVGLEGHHLISSYFSLGAAGEVGRCVLSPVLQIRTLKEIKEFLMKLEQGCWGGNNGG